MMINPTPLHVMKTINRPRMLIASILTLCAVHVQTACGLAVITLTEEVGGVRAILSGSFDLTGLITTGGGGLSAESIIDTAPFGLAISGPSPNPAQIYSGGTWSETGDVSSGFAAAGSPFTTIIDTSLSAHKATDTMWVPFGYVSGAPLTGELFAPGASFASLLLPLNYTRELTYTSSGGSDSVRFTTGASAVPEPSTSLPLLSLVAIAGFLRARRRRADLAC